MHNGNVRKIKRNQMYLSYAKEIFQKKRKTRKDLKLAKIYIVFGFFFKKSKGLKFRQYIQASRL